MWIATLSAVVVFSFLRLRRKQQRIKKLEACIVRLQDEKAGLFNDLREAHQPRLALQKRHNDFVKAIRQLANEQTFSTTPIDGQ